MPLSHWLASLATAVILTSTCAAVDLTKIDRTIKKEPTYKNKPTYCLAVFGPEAKTRIWMVLDGDVLYVDRNGNGDLTEAGKQVKKISSNDGIVKQYFNIGEITDPNSKTKYTNVEVNFFYRGFASGDMPVPKNPCMIYCNFAGKTFGAGTAMGLSFADKRQDAPIIHFGGSLTFDMPFLPFFALSGGEMATITARIGTLGLGRDAFAALQIGDVPRKIHPKVQIELPGTDAHRQPATMNTVLNHRCCGVRFYTAPLKIPTEACTVGSGKITLSFPDWREGKIAPATFEVPIEKAIEKVLVKTVKKLGGTIVRTLNKPDLTVVLDETHVTDKQLHEFKEVFQDVKELHTLSLDDCKQVTDAGLKELKSLKELRMLSLGGTKVTDAGLKELQELKNLQRLNLHHTKVTAEGVADLKKALPGLTITQ